MSLGEKIADAIPDSVYRYVTEHPRAVYLVSVPLVVLALVNLDTAWRVHAAAEEFVRARRSDIARAASEALGG